MNYIIISTWNGDMMSEFNTAEVWCFDNDNDAFAHIKKLAIEQGEKFDLEYTTTIGSGKVTLDDGENQGTYQYRVVEDDDYGVVIQCNVNEADVESKRGFNARLKVAIQEGDKEQLVETDLTANEIFIGAYEGDYDYQFIKL